MEKFDRVKIRREQLQIKSQLSKWQLLGLLLWEKKEREMPWMGAITETNGAPNTGFQRGRGKEDPSFVHQITTPQHTPNPGATNPTTPLHQCLTRQATPLIALCPLMTYHSSEKYLLINPFPFSPKSRNPTSLLS